MTFRVELAPAATRQLRKLDGAARRQVRAAIDLLAADPRPANAKKLVGGTGEWMRHWHQVNDIIGKDPQVGRAYALTGVITPAGDPAARAGAPSRARC